MEAKEGMESRLLYSHVWGVRMAQATDEAGLALG